MLSCIGSIVLQPTRVLRAWFFYCSAFAANLTYVPNGTALCRHDDVKRATNTAIVWDKEHYTYDNSTVYEQCIGRLRRIGQPVEFRKTVRVFGVHTGTCASIHAWKRLRVPGNLHHVLA